MTDIIHNISDKMFKTGHTLCLFPNILSKYYLTLKEIPYYNNILIIIRDNNKFDNNQNIVFAKRI